MVHRRFADGRWAPSWIFSTLALGTGLSVVVFCLIRDWQRIEAEKRVSEVVQKEIETLQVSMLRSIETLYSIAAWRAAHGSIEANQFRAFVGGALGRQPELLALSWNPIVPLEERAAFEYQIGRPIRELRSGELSAAAARGEFIPVAVIEPLEGNEAAVGYDLASDDSRHEALQKARELRQPVATAPIRLAQGSEEGVLVVLPVSGNGGGRAAEESERDIEGFAVAVFRVRDLVKQAFAEFERKGIRARLSDLTSNIEIIKPEGSIFEPTGKADVLFAEHRWRLDYQMERPETGWQALGALAGGLAFTGMTTAYLWMGWRRARDSECANERLQMEVIERQRAEEKAAKASEAKSEFLARMSHELRTPLNAILGYTQLIQKDPHLAPDHRDSTVGIFDNGRHLLGLINEVLDLSKIEAGRMELNAVDFSIENLCHAIEATFRPLCAQKRIGLRLELKEEAGLCLHGDEAKLRQILINLLGNAVKFTNAGEVFLGVWRMENDLWNFEVIDTGMGIPEEEQSHIFDPFHQGKTSQSHGGTGLGLAIARRQVELMGGQLCFETVRGAGTRFYFSIRIEGAKGLVAPSEIELTVHPMELGSVQLPQELVSRLLMAAELHSATALKNGLAELREMGGPAARLAEALRQLARRYDMEEIQRVLTSVTRRGEGHHEHI